VAAAADATLLRFRFRFFPSPFIISAMLTGGWVTRA
jgi:hypothetical protein